MIQKSLILVLLTVSLAGAVSMSHHLHEKSHEKAVKRSPHASALLELATAQQGDTGAMNEIVKMIDEKLIPDLKTTVETLKTNLAKAYAKFGECSSAKATCDGAIGVLDKAVTDAKALIAAKTTERDDAAKPATCTEPSFSGSDATSARDSAISAYTTAITARAAKYNTAATALASATTALGTAETAFGEKVGACKSACTTCNNDARTAYAALVEEAKKKQPYQREDLKTYELIKCVAKESGGGNDSTVLANCRTATPDLTWIAYDLKDMPYIHCEAGGTPVPAKVSKPVGCLDTSVVGTIKATGSGWTCGTCGDKPMVTSLTEGVSGFSFKIPDTTLHIMIGFGTGSDPCAHPGWEMAFGLCLRGQWDAKGIDIYESGVTSGVHNRLSRPYAAGDTFAVQIVDGKMVYQQNGATFFTSAVNVATYLPLTFDFSVYTPSGNAITDIKTLIYPGSSTSTSPQPETYTPPAEVGGKAGGVSLVTFISKITGVQTSMWATHASGCAINNSPSAWQATAPFDRTNVGLLVLAPATKSYGSWGGAGDDGQFVMHTNRMAESGATWFKYEFASNVIVQCVDVQEHSNGLQTLEGFAGPDESSLASVGEATVTERTELATGRFCFPTPASGKVFKVGIKQVFLANNYAFYRAWPVGRVA